MNLEATSPVRQQQMYSLDEFDFTIKSSPTRTKGHTSKPYDLLVGYRKAGKHRKMDGTDFNMTLFIRKTKKYRTLAIGVSKLKRHGEVLIAYDHPELPGNVNINHYVSQGGKGTDISTLGNKEGVIKVLNAFGCTLPENPDTITRLMCKHVETATKDVYRIVPVAVEYVDAKNEMIRREFDEDGRMIGRNPSATRPSNSRF